ncbi:MAG TPA: hypothetical protein VHB79_08325 [Polyangiaceae bacterium]|nr:hypothetical protein [Polyangiaceae bacterium]
MKRVLGIVTVLGLVVACGETVKRPTPGLSMPGARAGENAGGAAEREPDSGGGAGGDRFPGDGTHGGDAGGSVGGAAPDAAGEAEAGARSVPAGGAGGAGAEVEPSAGGAGAPEDPSCPLEPPVQGAVSLATTSFSFEPGFDVHMGQGADSNGWDGAATVKLLAHGCVTGDVTNQALLGAGGVTTAGGGTATLSTVGAQEIPIHSWFLPRSARDAFSELVNAAPERSLAGSAEAATQLWSYLFQNRKRSDVQGCGDYFVDAVVPGQSLTVVFKVTFPSAEESETFAHCYGHTDVTHAEDTAPAERYLVAHHAELSILALQGAGNPTPVKSALEDTGCSVAHLESCALTLDKLQALVHLIGQSTPDPALPVDDIAPWWGIFGFQTNKNTILGP